jgi:hypothetical protein
VPHVGCEARGGRLRSLDEARMPRYTSPYRNHYEFKFRGDQASAVNVRLKFVHHTGKTT